MKILMVLLVAASLSACGHKINIYKKNNLFLQGEGNFIKQPIGEVELTGIGRNFLATYNNNQESMRITSQNDLETKETLECKYSLNEFTVAGKGSCIDNAGDRYKLSIHR